MDNDDNDNGGMEVTSEAADIQDLTDNMKSLWVEKYAPRRYTELLSEEVRPNLDRVCDIFLVCSHLFLRSQHLHENF